MKIVCIADTHCLHREVDLPDGDLLIFAGDMDFFQMQPTVVHDFNKWIGQQPHRHKVVVPGNHDIALDGRAHLARRLITNAHLLLGDGVELEGLKIWGSPINPYANMPFGISDRTQRRKHWAGIPADTHVLVTHFPPHGVLDRESPRAAHQGCVELAEAIAKVNPLLHVFGHVHGAGGLKALGTTYYVNASLTDGDGLLSREPIIMQMELDWKH